MNSLLSDPELLSDTHLGLFLAQLQTEGYSIFVVQGSLPTSQADEILSYQPAVQKIPPYIIREDWIKEDWDDPQERTGGSFSRGRNHQARQQPGHDFVLFDSRNRDTRTQPPVGQRSQCDEEMDLVIKRLAENARRCFRGMSTEQVYPMSGTVDPSKQQRREASGFASATVNTPMSGVTMAAIDNTLAFSLSQVLGLGFSSHGHNPQTTRHSDLPFQQRHQSVTRTPSAERGHLSLPSLPPLDLPLTSLSTMPMARVSPEEKNHDSNEEDDPNMAFNVQVEDPHDYNQSDSNLIGDATKQSTENVVDDEDSFLAYLNEPESESDQEDSSPKNCLRTRRQVSEMTEEEMMTMALQLSQTQSHSDQSDHSTEASD